MAIKYLKKAGLLLNAYFLAKFTGQPSTASFWYLPEPANIVDTQSLLTYKKEKTPAPFYLMDYRLKLSYTLQNNAGIIVLPYQKPIGQQVNPEAAFQYALGLHDQYLVTKDQQVLERFWQYVNYFLSLQTANGDWSYTFDWFETKAPWSSALAQSRGASVMLRAWLHSGNSIYLEAAKRAVANFTKPTFEGGYYEFFKPESCYYFEEYPGFPTGVINGFMAALFGIWELSIWLEDEYFTNLWLQGLASLEKMLPYYSWQGWSLYDLRKNGKFPNVNSPRYHNLMISYVLVLSVISGSPMLKEYYELWQKNNHLSNRIRATLLKGWYKIHYR